MGAGAAAAITKQLMAANMPVGAATSYVLSAVKAGANRQQLALCRVAGRAVDCTDQILRAYKHSGHCERRVETP